MTHTPEQIAKMADGLSELACEAILSGKSSLPGVTVVLCVAGLSNHTVEGLSATLRLTETGIAIKQHLEARNDEG